MSLEGLAVFFSRLNYQEIFIFGTALLIGLFAASFFAGKEEGEKGRVGSLRIHVKDYVLHVHHWFYAAAIMVALPSNEPHKDAMYGFLAGILVQGLMYRDFYKLVYKDED
jgi:hypothetical protein